MGQQKIELLSRILMVYVVGCRIVVSALTARMASSTPPSANRSKIHCSSGLLTIGKRVLGLEQLRGRSLVAKPPAKINAFKDVTLSMD